MDQKAQGDTSPQPSEPKIESTSVNGHVPREEGPSRQGPDMEAVLNGGTHLTTSSSEQQDDPLLTPDPTKLPESHPKHPSSSATISKFNGTPPQDDSKEKSPTAISNGVGDLETSVKVEDKSDTKVVLTAHETTIASSRSPDVKEEKTNGELSQVPGGVPSTNVNIETTISTKNVPPPASKTSQSPQAMVGKDSQAQSADELTGKKEGEATFVPTSLDKRKEEKDVLTHINAVSKEEIANDASKIGDQAENHSSVNSTNMVSKVNVQSNEDPNISVNKCETQLLKEDIQTSLIGSKEMSSLKEDSVGKAEKETKDKEDSKGSKQVEELIKSSEENPVDADLTQKEKLVLSKTIAKEPEDKSDATKDREDKSPVQPSSKVEITNSEEKGKTDAKETISSTKSVNEDKDTSQIDTKGKGDNLKDNLQEDAALRDDIKPLDANEMKKEPDHGDLEKDSAETFSHDAVKDETKEVSPSVERGKKSPISDTTSSAPETISQHDEKESNNHNEVKDDSAKTSENIKPIEILEVKEIDKKEKPREAENQALQEQEENSSAINHSAAIPGEKEIIDKKISEGGVETISDENEIRDAKVSDGVETPDVSLKSEPELAKAGEDRKEEVSPQAPLSSDDTITLVKETQLADSGESADKAAEGRAPSPPKVKDDEAKPSKVKEIKINETTTKESVSSTSKERTDDGAKSPTKTPSSPRKPRSRRSSSPRKSPTRQPSPTKPPETKKLPPIKTPVGHAPMPNLKNVKSKIGSFDNIKYKPKISEDKTKKVVTKKLEWKAVPKVGSLDNAHYKPGGGDKKIPSVKLDFKERAHSRLGMERQQQSKSPETGDEEVESESGTRKARRSKSPHPHTKSKSLDVSGIIDGTTDTGSETEETHSEAKPSSSSRLKDKSKSMDAPSAAATVLSTEKEISPGPPNTHGAKVTAAHEDENRNREEGQEAAK